jgi:hypothetical protein
VKCPLTPGALGSLTPRHVFSDSVLPEKLDGDRAALIIDKPIGATMLGTEEMMWLSRPLCRRSTVKPPSVSHRQGAPRFRAADLRSIERECGNLMVRRTFCRLALLGIDQPASCRPELLGLDPRTLWADKVNDLAEYLVIDTTADHLLAPAVTGRTPETERERPATLEG